MTIRQLVGDCRVQLATLEGGSVQTCITSPPYWGLRDYGTPPLVWGGDPEHAHEWSAAHTAGWHVGTATGVASSTLARGAAEAQARNKTAITGKSMGSVCPCGAWLGSLGLEPTPELYVEHIVECFRHVRRVLRDDGTLWINLGDSYAGSGKGPSGQNGIGDQSERQGWEGSRRTGADKSDSNRGSQKYALVNGGKPAVGLKSKDLMMIPFRVAMALQADGWWLRSVIPWVKRNAMPESVQGSHWSRHQVKIAEYERLSGLRYTRQCVDGAWSGDVRYLPPTAKPGSKATISTESARAGNTASTRAATGRKGEATTGQPVATGENQQGEVRGDRERARDADKGDPEVQGFGPREGASARTRRAAEASPGLANTKEGSGPTLAQVPEGTNLASRDGTAAPSVDYDINDERTNGCRMAVDPPSASPQMLLLQEEAGTLNDGSRDSSQSGRGASERKRSAGLPVVQFEEEQPPDDALVDCPGCDQCRSHGGYIFHLSAGRPSTSTEYVFLLSKSSRYYWDADAVRQPAMYGPGRGAFDWRREAYPSDGRSNPKGRHVTDAPPNGRNCRNSDWFFESWQGLMLDEQDDPLALVVNPQPLKLAHFATFPPKLVEPMVKASTSERGQCPECGAPWVRMTESAGRVAAGHVHGARRTRIPDRNDGGGGEEAFTREQSVTTGWRASCAHTAEPVPCTILDCFSGAGTVLMVADRLGRNAIGCELKDDYSTMAFDRVRNDGPLFFDGVVSGVETGMPPTSESLEVGD